MYKGIFYIPWSFFLLFCSIRQFRKMKIIDINQFLRSNEFMDARSISKKILL